MSIMFVPNNGQTNPKVRFHSHGSCSGIFFTPEEVMFSFIKRTSFKEEHDLSRRGLINIDTLQKADRKLQGVAIGLKLIGSNPKVKIECRDRGLGKVNFLEGNNPEEWRCNLPTYGKIVYRKVWRGIDVAFYEADGQLKYKFIVHPGAWIKDIRLSYEGADNLYLDDEGNLIIETPLGKLIDKRPESYQIINGKKVFINCRFTLKQQDGNYKHGFHIGKGYNPKHALVIDPGINYSTFLGGSGFERGYGIAVDRFGSTYITGVTTSQDFPTSPGAFDIPYNGYDDVFVSKLSPDGRSLVYSTYLSGSDNDGGRGIAVDSSGSAYITGYTFSNNFPTTALSFDTSFNGGAEVFVSKLSRDGSSLVYSTYLGSSEFEAGYGIAVDTSGSAYVTGYTTSPGFPTTSGAFNTTHNGQYDAFVTKLSVDGSALVYSTFIGGSRYDAGSGIAVDSSGSAYITGDTFSSDFPTTPGAFDTLYNGNLDVFVTKLSPDGSGLIYSTYLGGSQHDIGYGIAVDASGSAYATGYTFSTEFPVTPGAFEDLYNGDLDAFVSKLSPDGTALLYSTFLGGSQYDIGYGIAVDNSGSAFVTGKTNSPDYPTTPGAFGNSVGGLDAFITKLATTPQGQISIIITEIQALVRQGVLNRGQGSPLSKPLNAAITQFNRGDCSRAIVQMELFITRVTAFKRAKVLTREQGQELVREASRSIDLINYLCSGSTLVSEQTITEAKEQFASLKQKLTNINIKIEDLTDEMQSIEKDIVRLQKGYGKR